MRRAHAQSRPAVAYAGSTLLLLLTALWAGALPAETPRLLPPVQVEGRPYGEELVGPYHQPRWSARGRFSADADVYVLPPYAFFLDADYRGTFPRRGKPDHLFTQEFEVGLPYRFQLAFELSEERQAGRTQVPFAVIEGRHALADWGKAPLNPTFMAEYRFGLGDRYPVEPGLNQGVENDGEEAEAEPQREGEEKVRRVKRKRVPDSYELRLLLGQELGKCLEFAANLFYDQDVGGDREREIGFSTAASFALRGEALKVGLEANYRNVSERGERRRAQNLFELGPSFTFKPSARTRVDVAPLAGVTHDSPRLELFAIFSIDFGAPEVEVTAPVSGGRY